MHTIWIKVSYSVFGLFIQIDQTFSINTSINIFYEHFIMNNYIISTVRFLNHMY